MFFERLLFHIKFTLNKPIHKNVNILNFTTLRMIGVRLVIGFV